MAALNKMQRMKDLQEADERNSKAFRVHHILTEGAFALDRPHIRPKQHCPGHAGHRFPGMTQKQAGGKCKGAGGGRALRAAEAFG